MTIQNIMWKSLSKPNPRASAKAAPGMMPTERVGSGAVLERTEHCPSRGPGGIPESRNTCCWALRAAAAAARHRGAKEMWIRVKDSKGEFVGQQIFLQNLQRQANTLICNSLWTCIVEEIDLQNLHHHHHREGKNNQAESILKTEVARPYSLC